MSSASTIRSFLQQYPDAEIYNLSSQKYDIPLIASSVNRYSNMIVGNSQRQSLGSGTGGIIQRMPVKWSFYVSIDAIPYFLEIIRHYRKN